MQPTSATRLCVPSWPLPLKVRDLQVPVGHAYLSRLFLGKACCIITQHTRREADMPSTLFAKLENTAAEFGTEDAKAACRSNFLTLCPGLLQCTRCRPLGNDSVQRRPRWWRLLSA